MTSQKDLMNEFYNTTVLTLGAVAISFASRKLLKDSMGVSATPVGIAKTVAVFGASGMVIKYMQDKKYLSESPFQ